MKKNIILFTLSFVFLMVLPSCFHHHDLSVSMTGDDDEFEMEALHNKSKTHEVEVYLNEHLLSKGVITINKRSGHKEIAPDDNTTININAYPGELKINIDNKENPGESCNEVERIYIDLKGILSDY